MLKGILIDPIARSIVYVSIKNRAEELKKLLGCEEWDIMAKLDHQNRIVGDSKGSAIDSNLWFFVNGERIIYGKALVMGFRKYWGDSCKTTLEAVRDAVQFPIRLVDAYNFVLGSDESWSEN